MGRGSNPLRLNSQLPRVWLVRWRRPEGVVATTVLLTERRAAEYAVAKQREGIANRVYVVDVARLTRAPDAYEFYDDVACGSALPEFARPCDNGNDAESVESVADGSPVGPAADLLDPAEVRADAPAVTPHSSRAGA